MAQKRISLTYTVLIWLGMVLCVVGAVAAIVGVGGSNAFALTFGDFEAKSTQVGLSIMVIGAALAGVVALKLPAGVRVLAEHSQPGFTEKLARNLTTAALIIVTAGVILLIVYTVNAG